MEPSADKESFRAALASAKSVIILSGAGLSAASESKRLRRPRGLQERPEWGMEILPSPAIRVGRHLLHPTSTADDQGDVSNRYLRAQANDAHRALATLAHPPTLARIAPQHTAPYALHVTQNVDALALRVLESLPVLKGEDASAVEEAIIEMHGDIFVTRCTSCNHTQRSYAPALASALAELEREVLGGGAAASEAPGPVITLEQLPRCGGDAWAGSNRYGRCGGLLRPEVVWFGEVPPQAGEVSRRMSSCDLLLVVGTSSLVYPAAGYAAQVKKNGGKVAVFNLGRSAGDGKADYLFLGPCDEMLPEVLDVRKDMANLWKS
ncbi:hypothetical protein H0H81_010472 [Sphagnurus paluster]|uniref:Deacetylase sirtuin-type domain-containing protein n=1 Tax=Sphagnurus paluster TaxID=117069 RepID=A0A9P7GVT1_9AGAR|nr:hypothetical protein H0H81_010472 [Sphagnurus paluster]